MRSAPPAYFHSGHQREQTYQKRELSTARLRRIKSLFVCLEVLRPSQPNGSCRVWSVYLTTRSELLCLDTVIREGTEIEHRYSSFLPEKIQVKFAKMVLGVNKSAVNSATLAELGLLPLSIQGLKLSVGFWHHVLDSSDNSLVKNAYLDSKNINTGFSSKVKLLFQKINFTHVWENEGTFKIKALMRAVWRKLKERFISFWQNNLFNDDHNPNGNKIRTYRKIKDKYELEKYLLSDIDRHAVSTFAKLRISNSKLFIEAGRHYKIPLEQRMCRLCQVELEDENHFVLKCSKLAPARANMINRLNETVAVFNSMDESSKLKFILSSYDNDITNICISGLSHMYILRQSLLKSGR